MTAQLTYPPAGFIPAIRAISKLLMDAKAAIRAICALVNTAAVVTLSFGAY